MERDIGIIVSDGKYYKLNSEVFELKDENLSDYFETILKKHN